MIIWNYIFQEKCYSKSMSCVINIFSRVGLNSCKIYKNQRREFVWELQDSKRKEKKKNSYFINFIFSIFQELGEFSECYMLSLIFEAFHTLFCLEYSLHALSYCTCPNLINLSRLKSGFTSFGKIILSLILCFSIRKRFLASFSLWHLVVTFTINVV